ncbi:hypothetical protein PUNSTDRAFT_113095 [Punctularia strigosozonata HHB-11173 SS5]|uniref:uncharacterized protein n=1 Tax=Punctularia strigosozonata (strain HHB-11173) TaxID=741275 RepID=UPI000441685C|nr:uncharacterized protein PUNSTDRAFT_113095 [Punctularia strigosozonata HHB-11173 SS5]EIN09667.1 hypothetical protein PUNSTDRAFT_113095 [Punctularia strigosozonata HHB-11173 SS5]
MTVETAVEHAKRAFALKKYEQAAELYAVALEIQTEQVGQDAPETADLYFSYGRALLENAIAQSSVLGKEQTDEALEDPSKEAGSNGAFISFSGDAEEEDEPMAESEDKPVDLFAEAAKDVEAEDAKEEQEEDDDAEPEDDFNAAWEVLELARAIYAKGKDADDEIKLKLADTYITLGDVSLETEKFDQAISDYRAGLALKEELLPLSSRQLAEAHYKLSLVLDMTSGKLSEAIVHAQRALDSTEARLTELRDRLQKGDQPPPTLDEAPADPKGKGKAKWTGQALVKDSVDKMSKSQVEAEIRELSELKEDLALKVEELGQLPAETTGAESAPELVAKVLDRELNTGSASTGAPAQVNDLTSMVKKKKKEPAANGSGKRKADDDAGSPSDKKAKLEDDAAS